METQVHTNGATASFAESTTANNQERPWHETLPGTLDAVATKGEAKLIGDQILGTKLPKGHQEVLGAWIEMCGRTSYVDGRVDDKLERLILEAKAEAGAENAGEGSTA